MQNSVISSEVNALTLTLTLGLSRVLTQALTPDQVNTHGAESELDAVTPVLRIEMRDACGEEIAISGLEELIEIAIPLQRAAYTEAQWERIENPAPPSASEEEQVRVRG